MKIRQPAVAGFFYPDKKNQLIDQLDFFFKKTKKINLNGKPKILISPHAGIVYSGLVAAWGYRQLESFNQKKVFLLGTSHYAWFNYLALSGDDYWLTPLGEVTIDKEINEKMIGKNIKIDDCPHQKEHSLELQLIFLQKMFSNFKIIPMMVSELNEELIKIIVKKISTVFDEESLLIVSTDLSHYPQGDAAQIVDQKTIKAILSGKRREFEKKVYQVESSNYFGLETAICGYQGVRLALELGEIFGLKWKKVFYSHSGEVSGDWSRVVGYASLIGVKS